MIVDEAVTLPNELFLTDVSATPPSMVRMRIDRTVQPLGEGTAPMWSPDGQSIAFWRNTPGGLDEIFVMNADGTGVRNLTNSGSRYENRPVWSPDGTYIVFDDETVSPGARGLGIIRVDGSDRRFIETGSAMNDATWFPDGAAILYHKHVGASTQVFRVAIDGTIGTALTTDTTVSCLYGRVSPNGLYLSYARVSSTGTDAMVVKELMTGHEIFVECEGYGGIWSPRSEWLYYTVAQSQGKSIARMDPVTGVMSDLSQQAPGVQCDDGVASLTSDGLWIAFTSNRSGARLVYMMKSDGSEKRAVTSDARYGNPSWKP